MSVYRVLSVLTVDAWLDDVLGPTTPPPAGRNGRPRNAITLPGHGKGIAPRRGAKIHGSQARRGGNCADCERARRLTAQACRDDDIVQMWNEGVSQREIAKQLGYGPNSNPPELSRLMREGRITARREGIRRKLGREAPPASDHVERARELIEIVNDATRELTTHIGPIWHEREGLVGEQSQPHRVETYKPRPRPEGETREKIAAAVARPGGSDSKYSRVHRQAR